jgi:hypothetical protein
VGRDLVTAAALFEACVRYLEDAGWDRDGDDPGMWRDISEWWSFGHALMIQLESDGVSMQDVPA